jgi:hypothetical protein
LVNEALISVGDELAINPMAIGVDWVRFEQLRVRGEEFASKGAYDHAAICWQRALQLCSGIPCRITPRGAYGWVEEQQLQFMMPAVISDAACALARVALDELRQPKMAVYAADRALRALSAPNIELVELTLRGAIEAGDTTSIQRFELVLRGTIDEYGRDDLPWAIEKKARSPFVSRSFKVAAAKRLGAERQS